MEHATEPRLREPAATQRRLARLVCASQGPRPGCAGAGAGRRSSTASIGLFKTPGLRDLGQSAPYLHTGGKDTLEDVRALLRRHVGARARSGRLRNGAPELARMRIGEADVAPLAAFLRALNEDYE